MRNLAVTLGLVAFAFACSSSSTSSSAGCASSGAAATVSANDALTFSPANATITHGQSVCWQNSGAITHTVTSNDGTSFNSNLAGGAIFQHTFPAAGAFPYKCTIHLGMTGTITVN